MPAQHKTCRRCKKKKLRKDFYKHPTTKDGKMSLCKQCSVKQSLKRQSYWRKKAIHALGGPTCVHCGCTVYSLLQINHIDGSGNLDRKKNGMVSGKFWRHIALGLRDVSNLEVVCYLCNQRHYVETILGHQGFDIQYMPRTSKKLKKI